MLANPAEERRDSEENIMVIMIRVVITMIIVNNSNILLSRTCQEEAACQEKADVEALGGLEHSAWVPVSLKLSSSSS